MNIKRAVIFSIALYIVYLVGHGALALLHDRSFFFFSHSLTTFVVLWIVNIPLVLFAAKWYFKHVTPTLKSGFHLGIFAMIAFAVLDGVLLAFSSASVKGIDLSVAYTDWRYYATALEVFLLIAYAGYEFDATYTHSGRGEK